MPEPTPEQVRFFETQVRPTLVENCFKCHGPEKQKGHLRLDSRAAVLAGGETGPAVIPGNLEESLLITAISHADDTLKMPPSQKLDAARIAALTRWVKLGVPWPGSEAERPVVAGGRREKWRVPDHREGPRPLGVPADRAASGPRDRSAEGLGEATRSTPFIPRPGSMRKGCGRIRPRRRPS